MDISKLRYILIPGAYKPGKLDITTYNNIYVFWKNLWTEVFNGLNFPTDRLADDFFRQTTVASICNGDEVVAAHLYTYFDMNASSCKEHSYIKGNYTNEFWQKMEDWNCRKFMSMEYFSVNQSWRKSNIDIPIAAVVAGLAVKVMHKFDADAAIAPARQDFKVNKLAYSFGADCVVSNLSNHNVLCDLISFRKGTVRFSNGDVNADSLIERLWQSREDHIFPEAKILSFPSANSEKKPASEMAA